MLIALALMTAPPLPMAADPAFGKLAQLYEDVCLAAFPDDEVAVAVLTARRATPLPAPAGRAWLVADGDGRMMVTIAAAPLHSCTVQRRFAAAVADLSPYRTIAARFKSIGPPFQPLPPGERDAGGTRTHVEGEARATNLGTETLVLATDTRADGGVEIRMIRRIRK